MRFSVYLLPFLNWGASVVLRENKLSGILYLIRHCFFSSASLHSFVFPCCYCYLVAKSCLTLQPHELYSPSGSSVHGISQARIPEWVTISSPRGSSPPRDQNCVSCIGGQVLYQSAIWEYFRHCTKCFFFFKYLCILDLAALGLCCHMWDL